MHRRPARPVAERLRETQSARQRGQPEQQKDGEAQHVWDGHAAEMAREVTSALAQALA